MPSEFDVVVRRSSSIWTTALEIAAPVSELVSVPDRFTPACAVGCAEYPKRKASTAPANQREHSLVDIDGNATLTRGCHAGGNQ